MFAAATVFFAWLFVAKLGEQQIRTGVLTYGLLTGLTAFGLWLQRGWGRSIALLISLASAGLGTLSVLAVMFAREGSLVVPAIVLGSSVAFAYWLSQPVFVGPTIDVSNADD